MTYKVLEDIPYGRSMAMFVGSPFTLFKNASELRLGYEIVRLAENPAAKDSLRVSGREDAGIGIDSNLPNLIFPKEAETRLGDYHQWSALHKYNWLPMGGERRELRDIVDRVRLMLTDEHFAEYRITKRVRTHPVSGETVITEGISPTFEFAYMGRFKNITSEEKIRTLEDPQWRGYAKIASRVGVEQILKELESNKQTALEQLADISGGKAVLESAAPRFDAIERLLKSYIEQMRAK